jgi:hypothetical protein
MRRRGAVVTDQGYPTDQELRALLGRRELAQQAAGLVRGVVPDVELLFSPSDHLAAKSAMRLEQSAQLLDRAHNCGVKLRRAYRYQVRSLPPDIALAIEQSVKLEGRW